MRACVCVCLCKRVCEGLCIVERRPEFIYLYSWASIFKPHGDRVRCVYNLHITCEFKFDWSVFILPFYLQIFCCRLRFLFSSLAIFDFTI